MKTNILKKPLTTPPEIEKLKIIDDVFSDSLDYLKPQFTADLDTYLQRLWHANPEIYKILKSSTTLEKSREKLYDYVNKEEIKVFALDNDLHILEKSVVRECIRTFRSVIGPINEKRTKTSALDYLWKLARGKKKTIIKEISVGFLLEFINLFKGIAGKSNIYYESEEAKKGIPLYLTLSGREAANERTKRLDELGASMRKYFKKYPSGLDKDVKGWREENKRRILKYFNADLTQWNDYKWQLRNVIHSSEPLVKLIELTANQKQAIQLAERHKIPFGITPYYLSLMDRNLSIGYDHAIRAQVIPSLEYVEKMIKYTKERKILFDFMGEHDTSPIELVTRRYPGIAIIKPYNSCAQICVYCQRNWEIDPVTETKALATEEALNNAIEWFTRHPSIGDVLITGGDPLILSDEKLLDIIDRFSKLPFIYRIRIGTRTPVVLPMRFSDSLIENISKYNKCGKREVTIVTHFEHSYEVTPEVCELTNKIKRSGISIYNQQVFTIENSRKFETAKLRKDLRMIGVDPYYNFNMKGKEEMQRFKVPIARILQEVKEEARQLPGLDRTDEPVFNVPKLGKNHLRAWQDHRVVMILPDGSRVYEFHPWEKNITPTPPFNYVDVPIYKYLEELASRGENMRDYRTIWYYY
ncbi:MAG: KamA family radical SAM protein [Ignavibacteriales bacterium]|nr:KamA family radical SAM protein [Ignavibacteriales bacterium]